MFFSIFPQNSPLPDRIKRQRFIFLAVLLGLFFLYPLISLANKPVRISGIPVLFLYIFFVWVLGIFLLYWNSERPGRKQTREE